MTAFVTIADRIVTQGTDLTTTGATDVYTAPAAIDGVIVTSIIVSEVSGNADAITLQWEDGAAGTLYSICTAQAIAANAQYIFDTPISLKRGSDIKATAVTANRLEITVTVFDPNYGGLGVR